MNGNSETEMKKKTKGTSERGLESARIKNSTHRMPFGVQKVLLALGHQCSLHFKKLKKIIVLSYKKMKLN
jgi:hypothetical protein